MIQWTASFKNHTQIPTNLIRAKCIKKNDNLGYLQEVSVFDGSSKFPTRLGTSSSSSSFSPVGLFSPLASKILNKCF